MAIILFFLAHKHINRLLRNTYQFYYNMQLIEKKCIRINYKIYLSDFIVLNKKKCRIMQQLNELNCRLRMRVTEGELKEEYKCKGKSNEWNGREQGGSNDVLFQIDFN